MSLLRALGDDVTDKAVADAHAYAIGEAMKYLAAHAGYTRTHNPHTGRKDLIAAAGDRGRGVSARPHARVIHTCIRT